VNKQTPDIWQAQAEANIKELINTLSNREPIRRKRAAAALLALGATDAIPALRRALGVEAEDSVRPIIATALQSLEAELAESARPARNAPTTRVRPVRDDSTVMIRQPVNKDAEDGTDAEQTPAQREREVYEPPEVLIEKLKDENPEVVIAAAHKLGVQRVMQAVEPLVLLFQDEANSIQVRLAVAEALLQLESAPVEVTLLANLRHPNWDIRRKAAAILGHLKAEWAIVPLTQHLRDPNETVRRVARAALRHIGTPEARRALARNRPIEEEDEASQRRGLLNRLDGNAISGGLLKHLNSAESRLESADESAVQPNSVTQPLSAQIVEEYERRRQRRTHQDMVEASDDGALDELPVESPAKPSSTGGEPPTTSDSSRD